jgi:hypothetical protein
MIILHHRLFTFSYNFAFVKKQVGPPLWSSGQSPWLQIQRSGFNAVLPDFPRSDGSGTGSTQPHATEELLFFNSFINNQNYSDSIS